MTYRLPDHPVIARLEREGWPLEQPDWLPEEEEDEAWLEEYESRPEVQEGWRQQDMIDLWRLER